MSLIDFGEDRKKLRGKLFFVFLHCFFLLFFLISFSCIEILMICKGHSIPGDSTKRARVYKTNITKNIFLPYKNWIFQQYKKYNDSFQYWYNQSFASWNPIRDTFQENVKEQVKKRKKLFASLCYSNDNTILRQQRFWWWELLVPR